MKVERNVSKAVAVALTALFLAGTLARAQVATTLDQAELAGLSPEKRAEVQSRMAKGGQTVYEILQTELLNSIKAKYPASRIVALDFNRGVAVVQLAKGGMRTVSFNTTTLEIKGSTG